MDTAARQSAHGISENSDEVEFEPVRVVAAGVA